MGEMIPKVVGADVELANFMLGDAGQSTAADAARLLLEALVEVTGAVGRFEEDDRAVNHHDWARFFLPGNGGCAYIDAHHLELCTPEQRSGPAFVAAWHGMLTLAQEALRRANRDRGAKRIVALVDNDDGRVSYGSHLNVLVARRVWEDILERRPRHLGLLASYQACSLVLTGQGRVIAGRGRDGEAFALAQRAHYLESLIGPQTTFRRPLVNTRDEAHCGSWTLDREQGAAAARYARLHVIAYDSSLCEVGALLKVGGLQILMAMFEAGCPPLDLALDDPVDAARTWSDDPLLERRMPLLDGREVTVVELQALYLERMRHFAERTPLDDIVPRAPEILSHWEETVDQLARGDWAAAAPRLDWALKLGVLERALRRDPRLTWASPEIGHLDRVYASLDPAQGLYWALRRDEGVARVVTDEEIERATTAPPDDTRAWTRAQVLRRVFPHEIESVDWDHVQFRLRSGDRGVRSRRVSLSSPLVGTRAEFGRHFEPGGSIDESTGPIGTDVDVDRAAWARSSNGTGWTNHWRQNPYA